jgi:hypothetical protein
MSSKERDTLWLNRGAANSRDREVSAMKRAFAAVLLVGLALVSSACGGGGATDLALGSAPWSDGDRLTYDWLDKNGNKVGTAEYSFGREGDAWVLSGGDKFPTLDQTVKVRMDAQTLRPLGAEKTIKASGTDVTVDTTYRDGKLEIKAVVNGEDKSASIGVPANILDNDQSLMTLRAVEFTEGYEGRVVNVVGQNAAQVPTTIRVQAREMVNVPAGSFEAWKVELDFGQAKHAVWYQVETPHNLVQYDNGNIKMVLAK